AEPRARSLQTTSPVPDHASHLDVYVLGALAGAFESAEAVVGSVQEVKGRAVAETLTYRFEKLQVRKFVTRAAKEEHRDRDRTEVGGTLRFRLAGLGEGEGEEDQTLDAIERGFGGGRGSHAATKGVAACQKREAAGYPACRCDCRANGCSADRFGVASFAVFHVREVVAERRDVDVGQPFRYGLEIGVTHVRAGPVAQDEQVAGVARADKQGRGLSLFRRGQEFHLLRFGSHARWPPLVEECRKGFL